MCHGELKQEGVVDRGGRHNAVFQAKMAIAALREHKTLSELCSEFQLREGKISQWMKVVTHRLGG